MKGAKSADPAAIRRLCLAVDIASYSGRTRIEQFDLQNRLLWSMAQGCQAAEITPARCDREDSGDGQILILPAAVDEARVIPSLVRGLLTALYRVNHPAGQGGRLQIRISLGQGAIQLGRMGFVSPSVIAVCRLLDSDELRDALTAKPDSDAALVVTTDLFDDMVSQGYGGLPASGFSRIRIRKPRKGFDAEAWVQVPDSRPLLATVPGYPDPADLKGKQEKAPGVPGGLLPIATATALAWATFAGLSRVGHEAGAPGWHHPAPHAPGRPAEGHHGDGQHDSGETHLGPGADAPGHLADLPDGSIHHVDPGHHVVHDPAGHLVTTDHAGYDTSSTDYSDMSGSDYSDDAYSDSYGGDAYGDGYSDDSYGGTSGAAPHDWFPDHGPGHHGTL